MANKPYIQRRQKNVLRLVRATIGYANSTVTLGPLAAGEVVVQAWADVLTAFNAVTTNVLTLGVTGTTNKFLTSSDVTEGSTGVTPAGGKGPFTAESAATSLIATYAQTSTRTVTDGVTTSGNKIVTSATAVFAAGDVGSTIVGTGIPALATIASVESATSATTSANSTASGTGVSLTIAKASSATTGSAVVYALIAAV